MKRALRALGAGVLSAAALLFVVDFRRWWEESTASELAVLACAVVLFAVCADLSWFRA